MINLENKKVKNKQTEEQFNVNCTTERLGNKIYYLANKNKFLAISEKVFNELYEEVNE
jgi:hypothetical protein